MSIERFSVNLGKQPFRKFTKSALIDMIEDMVNSESMRSRPIHNRSEEDDDEDDEKDEATKDADVEREKLADLAEETRGKPNPVEMDEEDVSDEAMDKLKKSVTAKKGK